MQLAIGNGCDVTLTEQNPVAEQTLQSHILSPNYMKIAETQRNGQHRNLEGKINSQIYENEASDPRRISLQKRFLGLPLIMRSCCENNSEIDNLQQGYTRGASSAHFHKLSGRLISSPKVSDQEQCYYVGVITKPSGRFDLDCMELHVLCCRLRALHEKVLWNSSFDYAAKVEQMKRWRRVLLFS